MVKNNLTIISTRKKNIVLSIRSVNWPQRVPAAMSLTVNSNEVQKRHCSLSPPLSFTTDFIKDWSRNTRKNRCSKLKTTNKDKKKNTFQIKNKSSAQGQSLRDPGSRVASPMDGWEYQMWHRAVESVVAVVRLFCCFSSCNDRYMAGSDEAIVYPDE